jgi:uncharacterized protein YbjT (DUF2867 family)
MISREGKTIVVVGATGRQGSQVVRHLVQDGWKVRALTRKPESRKASALQSLGAELVRGDLNNKSSLDAAFQNVYGVYNMQPPTLGNLELEIQHGKNVAEAAQRARIQHLVYGSAGPGHTKTGIEQWDAKLEVAKFMNDLGLPLTVLRPMAFMELMKDPSYYPQSSTWYIWPRLMGTERQIPWLSVQDLGAIAAKAFANPEEYMGKDLPLASDAQSLGKSREIYREVTGKYPSRFPMPMFLFEKFVGKDIPNMWRWLKTNPVSLDTSPTYAVHPEAMTVRTWLQQLERVGNPQ